MSIEDLYMDDLEDDRVPGEEAEPATAHARHEEDAQGYRAAGEQGSDDTLAPAAHPPLALDELELALTVRCGQVTLSLAQLRRLGPGTVLEVEGIAPGLATLCHADRVIAEGELVEVNGRLGLQITRMAGNP